MAIHKQLTGEAALHPAAFFQSTDPGAVGARKLWIDTTGSAPYQLKVRNDANSAWSNVGTIADLASHLSDASDAHDASAISYAGGTGMSATDVEAAVDELATEKANASDLTAHTGDTSDAHDASAISFVPAGTIAATDVQAAIAEVASEAAAAGATDLEGLSDVDLTSPAVRQSLYYDGSNFVNAYDPGHGQPPISKSANFTASASEYSYLVDATSGAVTATLPSASGLSGKVFKVRKVDSGANAVNIVPTGAETINGASSLSLTRQYQTKAFESNGTIWLVSVAQKGTSTPDSDTLDDLTDVVISSPATDDVLKYNGTNWVNGAAPGGSSYRTLVTLGSDQAITDVNNHDITGLSFSVTSGTVYRFWGMLIWDITSISRGTAWNINGPASPTMLGYKATFPSGTSTQTTTFENAYGSFSATTTSAALTGNITIIEGIIKPSSSGTVICRTKINNTGTITVKAGSTLEYW